MTQSVVDAGALEYFPKLIGHPKNKIRKEICWIVSNIAAGTQFQVEALIRKNYLPMLNKIIREDSMEIIREAVWAVCNFTSTDKKELAEILFNQGILETICYTLKFKDAKFIAVSLEALENLLRFGKTLFPTEDGRNSVLIELEKKGMNDYIENLQLHPVEIVYEKTLKILETYFEVENSS